MWFFINSFLSLTIYVLSIFSNNSKELREILKKWNRYTSEIDITYKEYKLGCQQ